MRLDTNGDADRVFGSGTGGGSTRRQRIATVAARRAGFCSVRAGNRRLAHHVELAEHRQPWARFAESGSGDALHSDGPDGWATHLSAAPFDAVLVMHHNLLLDDIGADGAERLCPCLHAPVGLQLGGDGVEAIALLIAAELQCWFSALA